MAEVKWIKLMTDMFDNSKIKFIRSLPEGNNIVLFWIMLLTKAGKCNSKGFIFLTENIPYTPSMLASELDFEINTVNLALETLKKLNMIQVSNEIMEISNWSEYQNLEGMDKIREQNRIRKRKQRDREKELKLEGGHVMSRDSHATEEERRIRKKNKNKKEEKETTTSSNDGDFNIFTYFQQRGFVSISSLMYEDINSLVDMYSLEEVKTAVDIADNNGIHKLTYVKGILERRRAGDKDSGEPRKASKWNYTIPEAQELTEEQRRAAEELD